MLKQFYYVDKRLGIFRYGDILPITGANWKTKGGLMQWCFPCPALQQLKGWTFYVNCKYLKIRLKENKYHPGQIDKIKPHKNCPRILK
jgi:hypothetical protein